MNERKADLDLTILMPCLNEENAVASCLKEAKEYLLCCGMSGEILVVDNGSTDRSAYIATENGARVIRENLPGYGQALRAGLASSRGKYIIMGDCDTTYDFSNLDALVRPLKEDRYDVMIGDRFLGGIEKGAMPFSHRIGVKALSALGRWRYKTDVRDFHCGLRSMAHYAADHLPFQTDGMEFATEMIALASANGFRIGQVPVRLRHCKAKRRSKLRALPDGFRHLKYICSNSYIRLYDLMKTDSVKNGISSAI